VPFVLDVDGVGHQCLLVGGVVVGAEGEWEAGVDGDEHVSVGIASVTLHGSILFDVAPLGGGHDRLGWSSMSNLDGSSAWDVSTFIHRCLPCSNVDSAPLT